MALVNSNNLVVGLATSASDAAYNPVAHAQSASLSFSNSMIDTTTKGSASWARKISGQKSWSLSTDGLLDYATLADSFDVVGAGGAGTASALALAGTEVYVQFRIGNQGYKGSGFIASFEQSGGTDDVPTFSISIEGNGILEFDADVASA